jgi:hypothetical protein
MVQILLAPDLVRHFHGQEFPGINDF